VWKIVNGTFLPHATSVLPLGMRFDWFRPHVVSFLFSAWHGFLSWTPPAACALIGVLWMWQSDRVFCAGAVGVLALQIYVNSQLDWWGGWSFGARRMVDVAPFLAVGFAAFCQRVCERGSADCRWRQAAYWFCGAGVLWSVLLALQLYAGITDGEKVLYLRDLFAGQWRVAASMPQILWRIVVEDQIVSPNVLPLFAPAAFAAAAAVLVPVVRLVVARDVRA